MNYVLFVLFLPGSFRRFTADYGVPLMVLVWTGISYAPSRSVPDGIPRRLSSPDPWASKATGNWTIIKDMKSVPFLYILGAFVPAIMIAVLYYFDHNVSAQLAQQKEFNLRKPSAFHYDLLLLGMMVLVCGLLGIPPSHGVIPQSPMHTKSLATLKKELVRSKLVKRSLVGLKHKMSLSQLYSDLQQEYQQSESPLGSPATPRALKELQFNVGHDAINGNLESVVAQKLFDPERDIEPLLPVEVKEQRLSNLMQSLMVGACVGAMPLIKKIPTAVLSGYFAYMAIESLPGNQFWERLCLLFTSPSQRYKVLEENHLKFVETVPFKVVAAFTVFQLVYLLACFGITWIPIAGVLFPVLIMLLIPVRQYILPNFLNNQHLQELDAAEYEEAPALPHSTVLMEAEAQGLGTMQAIDEEFVGADALDQALTRSRGEVIH